MKDFESWCFESETWKKTYTFVILHYAMLNIVGGWILDLNINSIWTILLTFKVKDTFKLTFKELIFKC